MNNNLTDVFAASRVPVSQANHYRRSGGHVLPIEVKSTARPRLGDVANLRAFRAEYGDTARACLLLHTGDSVEWLTPDVLAVHWWRVM